MRKVAPCGPALPCTPCHEATNTGGYWLALRTRRVYIRVGVTRSRHRPRIAETSDGSNIGLACCRWAPPCLTDYQSRRCLLGIATFYHAPSHRSSLTRCGMQRLPGAWLAVRRYPSMEGLSHIRCSATTQRITYDNVRWPPTILCIVSV